MSAATRHLARTVVRLAARTAATLALAFLAGAGACVGAGASAAADPAPLPNDFAEGIDLLPGGDAPLQRVELPLAVYAGTVRADLGDLRVFDPDGQPLPYSLVARAPRAADAGFAPLPLFPLPQGTATSAALQVRVDAAGAVVSVQGQPRAHGAPGAYLVDAGAGGPPLRELDVTLAGDGDAVGTLAVQAGDDLARFTEIVAAAPIARLRYAGRALEQRRVRLPPTRARYLRLVLHADGGAIALAGVRARRAEDATVAPRLTPFRHGTQLPQGGKQGDARVFDLGARLPLAGLDVDLAVDNSFVEAQFACVDDPDAPVPLGGGDLFRLRRGGIVRLSETVGVPAVMCRHVRVRTADASLPLPAQTRLRAAWSPAELWFLRRGAGPHLLAFGNNRVAPGPSPLAALRARLGGNGDAALAAAGAARLGAGRTLGGAAQRTLAAPIDTTRVLLWAVLAGGVVLVVVLAFRVARESR